MKIPLWIKFIIALVLLGLGLFIANYLAGFLFLTANKTNPFDTGMGTFFEYWSYYKNDPTQKKHFQFAIIGSLILSFGVPAFVLELMLRKTRSLHGDARFAHAGEVRKSGLLGNTGIIVGKYMNQYLMLAGQLFVMLAAPTRGGKGVGIVVPNLLNFSDSVIELDVKQENYDITSKYRFKYGHEVYLFNPFAEDGRTHCWNPLSYVSVNPHFRVSDILAIGYVLYPQDGKDAFFNDQARNLFLGLVLYLIETPELPCTISEALRQSSGKGKGIKEYLTDIMIERDESERPLSDSCMEALQRFTSNSDNTLASILASFNAPLTIWANPIVDAATSSNSFWLTDVRKKRMTIYLGVTPDKLSQSALIMNLFFSQAINLNTKELPSKNPDLKYQCLLLMDEFTAIGKVDAINTAVSYMAGYNLRLLPIIQSKSQLVSKYGEHDARTLMTNHALQILFPPRQDDDAKEYSETLGFFTMKSMSTSINNKGAISLNGSTSRGESTSDQRRALMLPQELKEMGQDKEIIIFENTKPIFADKIMYYKDHVFVDRLKEVSPTLAKLDYKRFGFWHVKKLPTKRQLEDVISSGELAMPVPVIDLDLHSARVQTRKRLVTEDDVDQAEENGGFNLAALAHDFSDLPAVDNGENPSPEAVSALVGDFFSRLEQRELLTLDDEDEEGFSIDLGMIESTDEDGVITQVSIAEGNKNNSPSESLLDLSVLDLDIDN